MKLLKKLFGSAPAPAEPPRRDAEESVLLVPIPALVALLLRAEQLKGAPLTEEEVVRIRDDAACMAMTAEMKWQLEEKRGYADLDPERVWEHWQVARLELVEDEG
ncbi:hypothetical protein [Pelomonas sp. BJYL3]|uniref:hypothetical protein n=1 Tax=Pelomonas sp. BJYL3 TaxID=2976697 RepID=UPI0022B5AC74|nr:hypothetical protein [Pelomonas sp. BJYL3]